MLRAVRRAPGVATVSRSARCVCGVIFAGTMAVYGLIHLFLMGRLRKISHQEILKNRE